MMQIKTVCNPKELAEFINLPIRFIEMIPTGFPHCAGNARQLIHTQSAAGSLRISTFLLMDGNKAAGRIAAFIDTWLWIIGKKKLVCSATTNARGTNPAQKCSWIPRRNGCGQGK
jgi:hypothetical protein